MGILVIVIHMIFILISDNFSKRLLCSIFISISDLGLTEMFGCRFIAKAK